MNNGVGLELRGTMQSVTFNDTVLRYRDLLDHLGTESLDCLQVVPHVRPQPICVLRLVSDDLSPSSLSRIRRLLSAGALLEGQLRG